MQDIKDTAGKLELSFKKELITPAVIDKELIDWDAMELRTQEIEKNLNIILQDGEDDIDSITELRKEIANSKNELDNLRKEIKAFLEKDSKALNDKFSGFIKRWEAVRKYLYDLEVQADQKRINLKKKEMEKLKKELAKSLVIKELEKFIIDPAKWDNKTCKMNTIEADIQEQINKLNSKYNSIALILKGINEKIETKIQIDDIINMFDQDQDYIVKYITDKEKQIRDAEETMRKKAEDDKQKAIQAEKERAEREKQAAIQAEKEKAAKEQQEAIEKAKEEERKKISQDIEAHENTEHYRNTSDIEKNENLTYSSPVQKGISDDDYIALVIKIKNSDTEKAIKLKNFLDSDDMELGYDKYIIPSFTDEKIYIEKDEYYEDVAEENGLIYDGERYTDSGRWSITKTFYYIREKDCRMFAYWRQEPATEMQEGGDFASSKCFYEVEQKIIKKY